jgi:hypothetical protein
MRRGIPELLVEGQELQQQCRFREAEDVFGRILLLDPESSAARLGLDSARRAAAESERELEADLEEAHRAIEAGDEARARGLLSAVVDKGGNRDRARSLLDLLDRREGRLFVEEPAAGEAVRAELSPLRPAAAFWRRALVVGWVFVFALLAVGAASSWERLVTDLVEPPLPAPVVAPPATEASAPSAAERALSEARRLAESGDNAAALALLDGIPPDEPAYPFARQLRARLQSSARNGKAQP